jgi:hypothetical protein
MKAARFLPSLPLWQLSEVQAYTMDEPYYTALGMITRARKLKALECTLRHGYPMQPYLLILSTVVNLYIYEDLGWPPHDIRNSNTQWLTFLRLFTAVENLITYPEVSCPLCKSVLGSE